MWIRGIVTAAALLAVAGCSGSGDAAGTDDNGLPTKITCDQIAKQAVDASKKQDTQLLKVRNPQPITDNRDTVTKPSGDAEALVLLCQGTGVWSDGADRPTRVRWTVDSDGDPFVYYRALQ